MTCIITGVKTKKELVEEVRSVNAGGQSSVWIEDPSIFAPWAVNLEEFVTRGRSCEVTNHPKRSWFASLSVVKGKIKVS